MPLLKNHSTNKEVVDFLVKNYFSTSTVTMSSDKYLQKSVHDSIIYPALIAAGILEVEQDPKQLEYAMFISTGGQLYKEGALSGGFENGETAETQEDPTNGAVAPGLEEEEAPIVTLSIEESKKDLEAHKDSLTSIINIINNANGIARARYIPFKPPLDQDNIVWSDVYSKTNITKGCVSITHPLTLNLDMLHNIDKYITEKFINDLFLYESKHLDTLYIPTKCLPKDILDLMTRVPAIMEEALVEARGSVKNSQLGMSLGDPFADMFSAVF